MEANCIYHALPPHSDQEKDAQDLPAVAVSYSVPDPNGKKGAEISRVALFVFNPFTGAVDYYADAQRGGNVGEFSQPRATTTGKAGDAKAGA